MVTGSVVKSLGPAFCLCLWLFCERDINCWVEQGEIDWQTAGHMAQLHTVCVINYTYSHMGLPNL